MSYYIGKIIDFIKRLFGKKEEGIKMGDPPPPPPNGPDNPPHKPKT